MPIRGNQIAVTLGAAVGLLGLLYGSGLLGHTVEDSFAGAFRANGTLLTPAGFAFAIWSVIYLGLAAFVVWQWKDEYASRPRIARISIPAALSLALNGVWLMVVQFSETQPTGIWLSVAVIVVLELSLVGVLRKLQQEEPADRLEAAIVDGSFGLYFGWTSVAVIANVSAALAAHGVQAAPAVAQLIAVVVLAVAAVLGVAFAVRLGGRISIAVAMAWGLFWIGIGRLTSSLQSVTVALAALLAAAIAVAAAVWVRRAGDGAERMSRVSPEGS